MTSLFTPVPLHEAAKQPHAWVIAPIMACFMFMTDELKLCGVTERALITIEGLDPFLRLARNAFQRTGQRNGLAATDRLLAQQPLNAQFAKELRDSDFSLLRSHSLVSTWAALESAVENTAVLILMKDSQTRQKMQSQSRKNKNDPINDWSEEHCRDLFRRWEQDQPRATSVGHRFERSMAFFDMPGQLSNALAGQLAEINALRNCIMHRNGLIDEKAVREAPTLSAKLHQRIHINRNDYQRYHKTISDYVLDLMKRIIASRHAVDSMLRKDT
jgi:hypothetical protein